MSRVLFNATIEFVANREPSKHTNMKIIIYVYSLVNLISNTNPFDKICTMIISSNTASSIYFPAELCSPNANEIVKESTRNATVKIASTVFASFSTFIATVIGTSTLYQATALQFLKPATCFEYQMRYSINVQQVLDHLLFAS